VAVGVGVQRCEFVECDAVGVGFGTPVVPVNNRVPQAACGEFGVKAVPGSE
jgi:hypothetical protein